MPTGRNTQYICRELLTEMVQMFKTGKPPIDPAVTLEIVAFIVAALASRTREGAWVTLGL